MKCIWAYRHASMCHLVKNVSNSSNYSHSHIHPVQIYERKQLNTLFLHIILWHVQSHRFMYPLKPVSLPISQLSLNQLTQISHFMVTEVKYPCAERPPRVHIFNQSNAVHPLTLRFLETYYMNSFAIVPVQLQQVCPQFIEQDWEKPLKPSG